jgi:hypothetical protein
MVGTWHSHPASRAEMSVIDREAMAKFRGDDIKSGLPTLFLIAGTDGVRAHMEG